MFIESSCKSIGETPNKQHFLQSNFLSNHVKVRLIIVHLSTEMQDPKTTFPKKTNPEKLLTNDYISSHTISKQVSQMLTSELFIEKHDQGIEGDAQLVLKCPLMVINFPEISWCSFVISLRHFTGLETLLNINLLQTIQSFQTIFNVFPLATWLFKKKQKVKPLQHCRFCRCLSIWKQERIWFLMVLSQLVLPKLQNCNEISKRKENPFRVLKFYSVRNSGTKYVSNKMLRQIQNFLVCHGNVQAKKTAEDLRKTFVYHLGNRLWQTLPFYQGL